MAKVSDLATAVETLTGQVKGAIDLLTAPQKPVAPAGDDPTIQPLLDQVNSLGSQLRSAVDQFKASQQAPATPPNQPAQPAQPQPTV